VSQVSAASLTPGVGVASLHEPVSEARVSDRLRTTVLGFLTVLTGASIAGAALLPYLLVKSPLLLVAVSAAGHHVALAAARVPPLPLIVIASLRRTLTGLSALGLGYVYGPATLGWIASRYPRLAGLARWLERALQRFGAPLLLFLPVPTVALLAGAARRRLPLAIACLSVGQAVYMTVLVLLGEAVARWTHQLTAFLREHLLVSTLVCASLILLSRARRFTKRRRAGAEPLRDT